MFSVRAPLGSGLGTVAELQVPSCSGTLYSQPCRQADCSSGRSDGFGTHGHKATLHLRSPPASPAHDTPWFEPKPSQTFSASIRFSAFGNEAHKGFSMERKTTSTHLTPEEKHCAWKEKNHNSLTGLSLLGSSELQKKPRMTGKLPLTIMSLLFRSPQSSSSSLSPYTNMN